MLFKSILLEQAADLNSDRSKLPEPSQVVTALLEREKETKKQQEGYCFDDLIGTWNLRFITGTKKTRKRAGIVLGAGRYIPKFIDITLTYEKEELKASGRGRVTNTVKLGFLTLSLSGPIEFISPKNILAFDFTKMNITTFGIQLYNGNLKNGAVKEAEFYARKLKDRAFFSYFLIEEKAIAARGRGGGLALWVRDM